jgi:hypothetical protein
MTDTTTNPAPAATPAAKADDAPRAGVAKHELIAEAGGEHTDMQTAVGIRYTDKASGESFEYLIPDAKPGTPLTMLALFGAKTKATNEASRIRNGEGGTTAEQLEAIDEVFANITKGVWREKAEGGGGSRTDKRLLATVLVESLGDKAQGTIDTYQNRLETEEGYLKKVMSVDAIKTEYRKRAGKTGPAIDTLA